MSFGSKRTCTSKPFETRESAKTGRPDTYAYQCVHCHKFHRARRNGTPRIREVSYTKRRALILDDFEATIASQMTRINERLRLHDIRMRRANMKTLDNGPLIMEGGISIAGGGDEIEVEHKK